MKAAQILLYGYCVVTPISYFSKMTQVKTMHDKPAYVQTQPTCTVSQSIGAQLGQTIKLSPLYGTTTYYTATMNGAGGSVGYRSLCQQGVFGRSL